MWGYFAKFCLLTAFVINLETSWDSPTYLMNACFIRKEWHHCTNEVKQKLQHTGEIKSTDSCAVLNSIKFCGSLWSEGNTPSAVCVSTVSFMKESKGTLQSNPMLDITF